MSPRVSLVIPAYNAEHYLSEALDSLLAQDYGNLEIIVVNDGSTDQTASILEGYADRIVLLQQSNQGQSASLNRAWQQASGDILGYLSADDRLEPSAVSKLVAALIEDEQRMLVYPDYWLIDHEGRGLKQVIAPAFDHFEVVINGFCPVGPGALLRRRVLEQIGGWDARLRLIPDWDFLLRVGLCGEVYHYPETLAAFRVHEQSQTFRAPDEQRAAEYAIAVQSFFSRRDVPASLARQQFRSQANTQVLTARLHLLAGRWRKAAGALAEASRCWPAWPTRYRNIKLLANGLFGLPRLRARNALRAWLRQRLDHPSRL